MMRPALFDRLTDRLYGDESVLINAFPLSQQTYFMHLLDGALRDELAATTPDRYADTRDRTLSAMLCVADHKTETGDLRLSPYNAMVAGFVLAALPNETLRLQADQLLRRIDGSFAAAAEAASQNAGATPDEKHAEAVDIHFLHYRTFLCAARVIPPELVTGQIARDAVQEDLISPFLHSDVQQYQALLGDAMIGDKEFPTGGALLAAHLYETADALIENFASEDKDEKVKLLNLFLTIYTDLACQHSSRASLGRAASQCYERYWPTLNHLDPEAARSSLQQSRDRLGSLGQGWNTAMDYVLSAAHKVADRGLHRPNDTVPGSKTAPHQVVPR